MVLWLNLSSDDTSGLDSIPGCPNTPTHWSNPLGKGIILALHQIALQRDIFFHASALTLATCLLLYLLFLVLLIMLFVGYDEARIGMWKYHR